MKKENQNSELSLKIGNVSDGFETLKKLCEKEMEEMLPTVNLSEKDCLYVDFWTSDVPEYIGVGIFRKVGENEITYSLDCSETTL